MPVRFCRRFCKRDATKENPCFFFLPSLPPFFGKWGHLFNCASTLFTTTCTTCCIDHLKVHLRPNGSDGLSPAPATRSLRSALCSVSLLPLWGFAFFYMFLQTCQKFGAGGEGRRRKEIGSGCWDGVDCDSVRSQLGGGATLKERQQQPQGLQPQLNPRLNTALLHLLYLRCFASRSKGFKMLLAVLPLGGARTSSTVQPVSCWLASWTTWSRFGSASRRLQSVPSCLLVSFSSSLRQFGC